MMKEFEAYNAARGAPPAIQGQLVPAMNPAAASLQLTDLEQVLKRRDEEMMQHFNTILAQQQRQFLGQLSPERAAFITTAAAIPPSTARTQNPSTFTGSTF